MIPEKLKKEDFRFVKIEKAKKYPFEKGWQKDNNYSYKEIEEWNGNYGVVCGYGDLVVIDCDKEKVEKAVEKNLPKTFKVRTGSGGSHFYFICKDLDKPVRMKEEKMGDLGDVQYTGKQVVGPGSIHPNGDKYKVVEDREIKEVSAEKIRFALKDFIKTTAEEVLEEEIEQSSGNFNINIKDVVSTSGLQKRGSEYQGAHPIHGSDTGQNFCINPSKNVWHCFRHNTGGGSLSWIAIKEGIIDCSEVIPGALRGPNFTKVLEAVKKKYGLELEEEMRKKEGNESKSKRAIELAKRNCEFFYDQFEDGYAIIEDGNRDIYKLKSSDFKNWLSYSFYREQNEGISSEAVNVASNTLEAYARHEGEEKKLNVRVGWRDSDLWYDLGKGEAIRITKDGWSFEKSPVMFKGFSHQKEQVKPERDSKYSIDSIFELLNPCLTDDQKLLLKVQLVANFIPGFPHPIMCPHGPQGSAKTFMHTVMRELIDPSELETLQFTTSEKELTQKISHHWFAPFDNITTLPKKVSNLFCRAVTGQGFSKRELYTNDKDVIYKFKRPLGLNGINTVPQKADLLDRTILYELERIPKKKRKTEEELIDKLEEMRPGILGSIFSIISKSIEIKKDVDLSSKPRMADFTEWGEAISRAMDEPPGKFFRTYQRNIGSANVEALEAHVIGDPLRKLVEEYGKIKKSPRKLLKMLNEKAEEMEINTNNKKWPKASNWVWRRINEIKPNLMEIGIVANRTKGKERKIILENKKDGVDGVFADEEDNQDGTDSKDSIYDSSKFQEIDDPGFEMICSYCGQNKEIYHKDEKGNYLCEECRKEEKEKN